MIHIMCTAKSADTNQQHIVCQSVKLELTSLVGKSHTLPYFLNIPPKILTLAGTKARHLVSYSSAVRLLTVLPSSGSSLLVNGKLEELSATTWR